MKACTGPMLIERIFALNDSFHNSGLEFSHFGALLCATWCEAGRIFEICNSKKCSRGCLLGMLASSACAVNSAYTELWEVHEILGFLPIPNSGRCMRFSGCWWIQDANLPFLSFLHRKLTKLLARDHAFSLTNLEARKSDVEIYFLLSLCRIDVDCTETVLAG